MLSWAFFCGTLCQALSLIVRASATCFRPLRKIDDRGAKGAQQNCQQQAGASLRVSPLLRPPAVRLPRTFGPDAPEYAPAMDTSPKLQVSYIVVPALKQLKQKAFWP